LLVGEGRQSHPLQQSLTVEQVVPPAWQVEQLPSSQLSVPEHVLPVQHGWPSFPHVGGGV
jgi:hypothetical protein